MSKILHFMNNQDDANVDELLEMQESALKSAINPDDDEDATSTVLPIKSTGDNSLEIENEGKKSFLEKNVVITGSISSVTSIEIEGRVNGNVSCENDVLIRGTVTGDINASNIKITEGQVNGNISSNSLITLDKDSTIRGNITGESLQCDGKVEGNTKVKAKANITGNAVIVGDIYASRISIEDGVAIKGKLQVCESNEFNN